MFSPRFGRAIRRPIHLAQKKTVTAEPNATRRTKTTPPGASMNARSVAHFEISMPSGARYMPAIPISIIRPTLGRFVIRPAMSSMSREWTWCSTVPTPRKRRDFATAWKMISRIAAQTASYVPIPPQATTSPRFATVEYASTRLAFDCVTAMAEAARKVTPPTSPRRSPGRVFAKTGANLTIAYTPALTIVEEWSRAETGVGATIAPRSQDENGSCAALVSPAKPISVAGTSAIAAPPAMSLSSSMRSPGHAEPEEGQGEADPADEVQHHGEERVVDRLLRPGVPDQDERAEGRDLPEDQEPAEVVREDDPEHGREEGEEDEEEHPPPVRDLRVLDVEGPHVRDGVDADRRADHADDQGHHDRELVHEEVVLDLHPGRVHDDEPEQERGVDEHEDGRDRLFILHREREDHEREEEAQPLEDVPGRLRGEDDQLGAFVVRRCEQVERGPRDHHGRDPREPVPDGMVRQHVQEHGRDQRGEQEEVQYVHKNPLLEYGDLSLLIILDSSGRRYPGGARAAMRDASGTGPLRPGRRRPTRSPRRRPFRQRRTGFGSAGCGLRGTIVRSKPDRTDDPAAWPVPAVISGGLPADLRSALQRCRGPVPCRPARTMVIAAD